MFRNNCIVRELRPCVVLQNWGLCPNRVLVLLWVPADGQKRRTSQLALHVLDDGGHLRLLHRLGHHPSIWYICMLCVCRAVWGLHSFFPLFYMLVVLLYFRLGFQYGHRVPVPQLEGVCPGLCSPSYSGFCWANVHAWEPTLPTGGIYLKYTIAMFQHLVSWFAAYCLHKQLLHVMVPHKVLHKVLHRQQLAPYKSDCHLQLMPNKSKLSLTLACC